MNNGNVNNNNKNNDKYVWPVRSGEWSPSPVWFLPRFYRFHAERGNNNRLSVKPLIDKEVWFALQL